jgi:hypothetical protein
MNTNEEKEEYLGCCACADEPAEVIGSISCADKKNVFTRREQNVLGKIREASLRARAIKEEIRKLSGRESSGVLLEEARGELEQLRRVRDELEAERIAAAEERMRMLGHLQ